MIIGIPKETQPRKKEWQLHLIILEHLQNLIRSNYWKGAGEQANLADSAFMDAGARIVDDAAAIERE